MYRRTMSAERWPVWAMMTRSEAPPAAALVAIERYLGKGPPEALSQAALEVLAIVAYEQPVTRADIRAIRQVDSDVVVETLVARKLIAEDPRFGGRGRPSFLVTTELFLRRFGLGSLGDLPPRASPDAAALAGGGPAPLRAVLAERDNHDAGRTSAYGD
jgi:chromosome segregation and condensation protein ScpB